jgi:hypothetical protein
MFSNLSFSLAAALVLSAAAGAARAASPANSAESGAHHSSTNDEIGAAETGNPHSVDSNKGLQGAPKDSSSPAAE